MANTLNDTVRRIVSVMVVVLLITSVANSSEAFAAENNDLALEPSTRLVDIVELEHPVSVRETLEAVREIDIPVRELSLDGRGFLGGYFPTQGPIAHQEAIVYESFHDTFGAVPVVSSVLVSTDTLQAKRDELRHRLALAPVKAKEDGHAESSERKYEEDEDSVTSMTGHGQNWQSHFPTWVEVDGYQKERQGVRYRLLDHRFGWGGLQHTPKDVPADWGIEIGSTIYNEDLIGTRPLCTGGDEYRDFWSQDLAAPGTIWSTSAPSISHPYPDSDLYADPCTHNGLEFGIGYPKQLTAGTTYVFFYDIPAGTKSSSNLSIAARIVSNDCNDLFRSPHTSCMGLNANRIPPGGRVTTQSYAAKWRGFSFPGCSWMVAGDVDPTYTKVGAAGCPWKPR